MASEIRANSITSRAGLSTVTMTDSGPMFSGITTFVDNSGFTFGVGGGTSIFTPATNILTLGTNNTEKVRIDANGNTNITGVTTAANFKTGVSNLHDVGLTLSGGQIDVGSNIKIGTAGVVTATSFVGSGANLTGISAGTALSGSTNNTVCTVTGANAIQGESNLTFDGTQLQIGGDSGVSGTFGLEIYNTDSNEGTALIAGTAGARLDIMDTVSSERLRIAAAGAAYFISYKSGDPFIFQTTNGSGTAERLRITSDGKFGLGTNNPGQMLHLSASSGDVYNRVDTNVNGGMLIYVSGTQRSVFANDSAFSGTTTDTGIGAKGNLIFRTGTSSYDERFRITSTGQATFTGNKVRINGGTTARSIDVETTFGSGGEIASFQNNASNAYGGLVISGGEIDRECRMEAAWGSGFMTFWTDNAERVRINSSGQLGVNDTGSGWAEKLQVTGNYGNQYAIAAKIGQSSGSLMRFGTTSGVCGSITGNGTSSSFNTSSDYRLKENDVKITDGITRIKQLRPIRFNWKTDSSSTQDGFFAHEVSTIVPESVTGEKDATIDEIGEGYQKIDHSKLVPLLTAALQEAVTRIETLEQDNIALRARVTNLEGN